jgi:hypothetical protein
MSNVRKRQQKRQSSRLPAVWRGNIPTPPAEGAERERPEHGIRDELRISARFLSGAIVLCLFIVLVIFFGTDIFYVKSIRLEGSQYLNEGEVFRYADIANQHLLWVDPEQTRQNIINATPLVANARVSIGWPPDMVTIIVQERLPALVWEQGGTRTLIDVQGNILRSPRDDEEFPDLLTVTADESFNQPRLPDQPIPLDVVSGALQLQRSFSGLPSLSYNADNGLGFTENDGAWQIWLGTGTDMPNKLRVYQAVRDNLLGRGIVFREINVADLNSIYYYCENIEICYE